MKALRPRHAGQVDLVFIDPPYNTGNEGWCYGEAVTTPTLTMIRADRGWLRH